MPVQPGTIPAVTSIVSPDGRVVTGYTLEPAKPEPVATKPAVSRAAVNIALGGIGLGAVCGGLVTTFICRARRAHTPVQVFKRNHFHG